MEKCGSLWRSLCKYLCTLEKRPFVFTHYFFLLLQCLEKQKEPSCTLVLQQVLMSAQQWCLGTAHLALAMNHIFAAYGFILQPSLSCMMSLPCHFHP